MKIIITGVSGFVGRNLKQYLQDRRYNIEGLSLRNENWENHLDQDATAIIHLAGKAHDTSNTSADEEYFKVNRDLTIKLFNLFLKSNIRDFFYFSSVKAVADTVEGTLQEDAEGHPYTPYGKSKLEAEHYLLSRKLPENKRLFIIRPCMIHGPGNKGNLNLLYKVVKKGLPWPLAEFHNRRSFLSIDNLCYLIEQMLVQPKLSAGIFNFADDEALSTNALVKLIGNTINKAAWFWYIPTRLVNGVAKIGDVLPLPLNSERLKKLTESYVVSNKKIKEALGIDELPLTAKEGLEKTVKSFND